MRRNTYAHTGYSSDFPAYVSIRADGDETCGVIVAVRDHAKLVETENGSHLEAGNSAESLLSRDHAMDLAKSLLQRYAHISENDGIGAEARARFFPDDVQPGETSRTYESIETVGEVSHTRRLVIASMHADPLTAQVANLASFILQNFDGEPSEDQGAIDTAIRLLEDYAGLLRAKHALDDISAKVSRDHIAAGLRAGQAESYRVFETVNETVAPGGFINVGTQAKVSPLVVADDPPIITEAAHPDGSNEPATHSAPLLWSDEGHYIGLDRADGAFDVVSPQPAAPSDLTGPVVADDDLIPF